jgi:phosphopantothenoylcysteine synthetase/decarboxylase
LVVDASSRGVESLCPLRFVPMNILVTAGNTLAPIDRVRCITNIFTGRTGTRIALHAQERGHAVTLLTSHPEVVAELRETMAPPQERWQVQSYRIFEDLQMQMERAVRQTDCQTLIHCAAVSDYLAAGIYAPIPETRFDLQKQCWQSTTGIPPMLRDRAAGKVKSDEPELWLRLVRAPKLVDLVRSSWGFSGILVKFKLEVGIGEDELRRIAERSRCQSGADLMVANTLEGAAAWAILGPVRGTYERVGRMELAPRLLELVEQAHKERGDG